MVGGEPLAFNRRRLTLVVIKEGAVIVTVSLTVVALFIVITLGLTEGVAIVGVVVAVMAFVGTVLWVVIRPGLTA